jgi:lipid II:glycine glycyltransferase (peptidoglycan interpeptide bridge formation enzyme)
MAVVNQETWNEFLSAHADAHILQTAEWGRFKQEYGWYPKFITNGQSGAMVLFRRLPLKRSIAYIPKGPVGPDWRPVVAEALQISKREGAILLYVEPDAWENCPECGTLVSEGFTESDTSIQPRQTIILSLAGSPEDWLDRMKQKTRYNIRLAEKKEVQITQSADLNTFTQLMKVTGERDAFGIHQASYYQKVFELFSENAACMMFIASYEEKPLAAIMVFRRGKRAWYFYGASNNHERNRMPTYLLQWEAMKWAAEQGVESYDLWGIPDGTEQELEEQFASRDDGLWGVYRFKRGFGGEIKRSAGVYQKVINQPFYIAFRIGLKFKKSLVS